ncbi:Clp protease N-terminal domain-containing protein [Janthinobacterium fluminis]|uniref:Clp protease N-terminal domain-containing protein n=1 Tax=Janthinobacterium fluminis TaxID=2987524 RepID=A0ABT5K7B2_9BURK|nr:Clp protease N-terminal domain-containing protein [Janthinobacterium fluminis]MDC8760898.1 Clp protease N-terminal domain-containing protein [Janthinobacterium fluminis]
MFDAIKKRFRDMGTIKALCESAERHANSAGQAEPGAEHFVLAALDLPDGTARQVFARLRANPDGYRAAIAEQYASALRNVGIAMEAEAFGNGAAIPGAKGAYASQPSAQALMRELAEQRKSAGSLPLLGVHVILAAAQAQFGVAARALQAMGVSPAALAEAARAEIAAAGGAPASFG